MNKIGPKNGSRETTQADCSPARRDAKESICLRSLDKGWCTVGAKAYKNNDKRDPAKSPNPLFFAGRSDKT